MNRRRHFAGTKGGDVPHTTAIPTPIVAQAESATDLPGLKKLCAALKSDASLARKHSAAARISRLEIARQLCVYGERSDVKREVSQLEEKRRLQPGYKGGRPFCGRTLAAKELASTAKIPERTLYAWLSEWSTLSTKMDWPITLGDTIEQRLIAMQQLTSAGDSDALAEWFEKYASVDAAVGSGGDDPAPPEPDEIARKIVRTFTQCFFLNGHVRLDRKARIAVMRELNPALRGMGFEILPIGKE
jgi:hypothetical protein